MSSIKTSSDGAWQGDDPLHYAFPLLIIQTTLVLLLSRFLAFILKPLRQPKVVAEIAGGILLGPSGLGRNKEFMEWIFPSWSTPILESVASIGLLFFLFLVGLELDLSSIRRSSKRAFGIAAAGISLPFLFGVGVTFLLRRTVAGADRVGYVQYLMFMGVSLSITAFPVLARILAELKLLTTQVGETAMAAAAFNDVAAWIMLTLAIAIAGNGGAGGGGAHKSPLISIWVLISGVAFVAFMLVIVRPAMNWIARRSSPPGRDFVDEECMCLTLAGVMISGFMTDLIGIHAIFGAFVFGLTIPKGGEFAGRLIKRIEDFVSGLLLPLYFASSGLKTDFAKMRGVEAWGLLALVISTACAGKILGTFLVAMLCMIPARESLALGVLMNTKGLVELIVLNIGKEKKVLNDETFAILVIMALFTTFMTTPTVMAIYRRGSSPRGNRRLEPEQYSVTESEQVELRVLACVHGPGNSSSLTKLVEATRSTKKSSMKLYVMRLIELTDRPSSIVMVQLSRKNGFPCTNPFRGGSSHSHVMAAFEAYSQLGRVTVRATTAISALPTMHEDICHVAEEKRVAMIVLPFHKQWRGEGNEEEEDAGLGWRGVNQRVLKNAPCSVAVLVDRGFGANLQQNLDPTNAVLKVCVIFFGGPDNREALELGSRIVQHPAVRVTVARIVQRNRLAERNAITLQPMPEESGERSYSLSVAPMNPKQQKELDDAAVAGFQKRWNGMAEYVETVTNNIMEAALAIGRSREYELLIVGKGRFPPAMVEELAEREAKHVELGPVGDLLASSGKGIVPSVLVIQQHDLATAADEAPVSKTICGKDVAVPV